MKILPLSAENYNRTLKFLESYEYFCTELMEHFLTCEKNCFILLEKNEIEGVLYRFNKILLHCIPFAFAQTIKEKLLCHDFMRTDWSEIHASTLVCIIGEQKGTALLIKRLTALIRQCNIINYRLMINKAQKENRIFPISPKYELVYCHGVDLEDLLPLQFQYEKEEIFSELNILFSDFVTRSNLRRNLRQQIIIALKDKELVQFVSKAGTNAIGKHWVQIGGVFTCKEYRRLGLSYYTVSKLTQKLHESRKNCVLFVKEKNPAAFNLYKKIGYEEAGKFSIVYLEYKKIF